MLIPVTGDVVDGIVGAIVGSPVVAPVAFSPGRICLPMKSGWSTKSSAGPATTVLEFVVPFILDGDFMTV